MGLARQPVPLPHLGIVDTDGPLYENKFQSTELAHVIALPHDDGMATVDVFGGGSASMGIGADQWHKIFGYVYQNIPRVVVSNAAGDAYDVTGGVPTTITTAGSKVWSFAAMQDSGGVERLWMVNGADTPKRWTHSGAALANWVGGIPTSARLLTVWKGRMIASGSATASEVNRVWFSDIGNPESFPGSNFIDIGGPDFGSEDVVGLAVMGENLLVLKEQSIWVVYDSTNFNNRKISDVGLGVRTTSSSFSEKPYTVLDGRLYWLTLGFSAVNQLWSTDGSDVVLESDHSRLPHPYSGSLEADGDGALYIMTSSASAGDSFIALPRRRNEDGQLPLFHLPSLNKIVKSLTRYDDLVTGVRTTLDDKVYFLNAESSNGSLTPPWSESYFDTSWFGLQETENKERIRRVTVVYTGRVKVSLFTDFDEDTPAFEEILPGVVSSLDQPEIAVVRPEVRGRYFKLRFEFSDEATGSLYFMRIYQAEVVYRGGREH